MSDTKVLSKDEVDALLKITQEQNGDLSKLTADSGNAQTWSEQNCAINNRALTNVAELTVSECEKILTSFLRKKIGVKSKETKYGKMSECLAEKLEKHVYTVFQIMPSDHYGMIAMDLVFLHHAINLLYGGQINTAEPVMESPGKVGLLVADRISQQGLDALEKASEEYSKVTCSVIKTIEHPNLTSKLNLDDNAYMIDMTVAFGELEGSFSILLREEFLRELVPMATKEVSHVESNFWRSAIETQVIDSYVTVNVTLPGINVKMNEVMKLKDGDLIPIGDPTLVYVCLNDLKLFRANAGQSNSKRVAKILSEV